MRPIRAIRFDGAGLAERAGPDAAGGLTTSLSGGLMLVEGGDAVRQSIMLLLTTMPGERVMRPDYGCPIHRLVFSPNDATTAGLAIHYVRQAITRWEPRVRIVRLDAGADRRDPGRLVVTLEYRIRATDEQRELTFDLRLDGQPG
jgi:phage baseplate assembly protein W